MKDVRFRLVGKSAYCYKTRPVLFDKAPNHLHNRGKGLKLNLNVKGE